MKEFTLQSYRKLLEAFLEADFVIMPYRTYPMNEEALPERVLILRHDIDRDAPGALEMARLEKSLGVRSSFYSRIVPQVYRPDILHEIVHLGHELGYHYEDYAICNGDKKRAIQAFGQNLERLRGIDQITTACMHGIPYSKWDNRKLWNREKPEFKHYGIIAEPYFDERLEKFFYLTDAGRSWNNPKTNRRDWIGEMFDLDVRSIPKIMSLIKTGKMPNRIMLNIHPHNWTDNLLKWHKLSLWQSFKNLIKLVVMKKQDSIGEINDS